MATLLDRRGGEPRAAPDGPSAQRVTAAPERVRLPAPYRERPDEERLVAVMRDALDQSTAIVRDAITLGGLEAARMAKRELARAALALAAFGLCFVGVVLGLVASFLAADRIVPSISGRLALFSLGFLLLGVVAVIAAMVFRPREGPRFQGEASRTER